MISAEFPADAELNITNDGPAILDSRITFVARLEAGSHTNLRYVFRHDVPGVEHEHTVYNDTTAVLALVFESGKSSSGLYTMEVTVFKDSFFTIRKVAYGKSPFTLTRKLGFCLFWAHAAQPSQLQTLKVIGD